MDELVKQSLTKWPNVPHCYGWLALDARGAFRMRDEAAQAAHQQGDIIRHESLLAFIYRNYDCDNRGAWYFQNGPQRVYVELEATPFVWRVDNKGAITSSAKQTTSLVQLLMDERGWPYLHTSLGFGLVHTQDVASLAQALELQHWPIEEVSAAQLPARFGYQCVYPSNTCRSSQASGLASRA
jgi:hypothetical protein